MAKDNSMRVWFCFRYRDKRCFNSISTLVSYNTLDDITLQLRDFIEHRDQEVVEAYWINDSLIRTYVRREK